MFLDEISTLLFKENQERKEKTQIIYGTALADSSGGEVLVKIDADIYSYADEDMSNYAVVDFTEDDDDLARLDNEEESDLVYWESEDDYAVEDEEVEENE